MGWGNAEGQNEISAPRPGNPFAAAASIDIFYMKKFLPVFVAVAGIFLLGTSVRSADLTAAGKEIPAPLKIWEEWATWNDRHVACPTPYQDPNRPLCFWPSRLHLDLKQTGGRFDLVLTVFHGTWVPLPGGKEAWPMDVRSGTGAVPVVEHGGRPGLRLAPGTHRLSGGYRWNELPQRLAMPREIGMLALTLEGKTVEAPVWDAEGFLWLKRTRSEQADKDFLGVKVYRVIEDGIPMSLRSEIELSVSGKSREIALGSILPAGWQLAMVDSPIPVAVDDQGKMKAQVHAGKWIVRADAFRLDHAAEVKYADGITPAVPDELIAFRSQPSLRLVEVTGVPSIDVSQTTFPDKWRELPVYRWETTSAFRLEERMRGMGLQKPEGLTIQRELWLGDRGGQLVFRDRISGNMQQIWRLDAAENQDLGSVRSAGQGQLITRNPQNGAPGIEIRTRQLNLEATGRMARAQGLPATGWRTDADNLNITLHLPPGWRLFALFGADWVQGDWLTAWSLLDLFLLLIFSLSVYKLWDWRIGLLAFFAFSLSYHEPDAPRYVWLALLLPVAVLRVVSVPSARRWIITWKYATLAVLLFILIPFIGSQVQQALYPQLENRWDSPPTTVTRTFSEVSGQLDQASAGPASADAISAPIPRQQEEGQDGGSYLRSAMKKSAKKDNLTYDAKARIQTGPGVPEWTWRSVQFGWNGPVQESQRFFPLLIPQPAHRVVTVLRVALLILLAAVMLGVRERIPPLFRRSRTTIPSLLALCLAVFVTSSASAQIPDAETLKTLRERLLEKSDAYPLAADIPSVSISLQGRRLIMNAEIHTAIPVAVPLPGRLPAWSPVSVQINGGAAAVVRRHDDYLWVSLPAGVHQVRVEGLLSEATEWEWTFLLKPRYVRIDAPGWTFSGVRPDGVPEQQVFFAMKQKAAAGEATYDRQDFHTAAVIDRHLELGLIWQVRNRVTRLSPEGKAVSLRVPLLPGENVLSSNLLVQDGYLEVRLGAHERSFTWESELPISPKLQLATRTSDSWVERWHLVASPVWNVVLSGLAPVFQAQQSDLVPVWHPWPGETAELAISRPEAVSGATVTVHRAHHTVTLGSRQRTSDLKIDLQSSLGEDFLVGLPAKAEITSLTHNGTAIPVRKDGSNLIIPLRPGEQTILLQWKTNVSLDFHARADEVRLPVESANLTTVLKVPENRWLLWTHGPLRGPAVRLWGILICSLLIAGVLSRLALSPLRASEWVLLALGLTQVHLAAALVVVGWFFLLAARGRDAFQRWPKWRYDLAQVGLILLSFTMMAVLINVVASGLLGHPEMFILGNGSTRTVLQWYQARVENVLPQPGCFSVSIWWYRFFMLAWALWLAASLIRWLKWGWQQFSIGGVFRPAPPKPTTPPALPVQK
jgi:hypothetical protein